MTDPTEPSPRDAEPRGPRVRTDLVDVYVFRRDDTTGDLHLLQLRRTRPPAAGLWHPIMGHVEPTERAAQTARRELAEEVGLDARSEHLLGLWQLEQIHPYFVAELDAVFLSPRFAARVTHAWEPRLGDEHDAARWVHARDAHARFLWPGQRATVDELVALMRPDGPGPSTEPHLRVPLR